MPHKEEKEEAAPSPREFTPNQHPEFPDGFPTVALETISLAKLLIPKNKNESGDGGEAERERERERDRVFEACKGRGFFYLDLTGCAAGETISRGADRAAAVAEDVFRLTLEEKMVYRLEAGGGSLDGYKVRGATLADPSGVKDTAEFFNVGKNESELSIAFYVFVYCVFLSSYLNFVVCRIGLDWVGLGWASLRGWYGMRCR